MDGRWQSMATSDEVEWDMKHFEVCWSITDTPSQIPQTGRSYIKLSTLNIL